MSNTKKNPKRKQKVEQFKKQAKKTAAQAAIPKTHLVPVPTWKSDANLALRGDLMEVIESQLAMVMDAVQKVGQAMYYVMQQNIKEGGITLEYSWNNGEKATEAEIAEFQAQQKELAEARNKQMLEFQQNLQAQANAARTGLVGPDGTPIGTDQDLSENEEEDEYAEGEGDEDTIEEFSTDEKQPSNDNDDNVTEE